MEGCYEMLKEIRLERDAYGKLLDAVADCNYPALYACLRKEKGIYFHDQAYRLCSYAIQSGCTLNAFRAILEHCVPLKEFLNYGTANGVIPGKTGGLVQEAAANNRGDILKYLLKQGFSPNARGSSACSALEAALWNGAIGCVRVLQQRDDVDFTITETILNLWGSMGQSQARDICFRIIAGRLLGARKDTAYQEIPLLPGMNVLHAADRENWPLVHRLCRETTVTEKQGKQVLNIYMDEGLEFDGWECTLLLEALFNACPGLLRCEYPRYVLSLCMLCGTEEMTALLQPWVENMPGKQVVLAGRRLAERPYDLLDCLHNWEERMGSRLRPVLRRDRLLPVRASALTDDEAIRTFMQVCEIQGNPPVDRVSHLAKDVLQLASPGLVMELYEQGKLFPEEDAAALLEYCETLHLRGREKRNILLAYGTKQRNYDL